MFAQLSVAENIITVCQSTKLFNKLVILAISSSVNEVGNSYIKIISLLVSIALASAIKNSFPFGIKVKFVFILVLYFSGRESI